MVATRSIGTRPKILCLGVSYADIHAELKKKGYTSKSSLAIDTNNTETNNAETGVLSSSKTNITSFGSVVTAETAIRCVEAKVLNQMDGRDLTRILATEELCQVDIYCVSQEKGATYRSDRHLDSNFNRPSFVQKLQTKFLSTIPSDDNEEKHVYFDQIILDYYWIPTGWDAHHWSMNFFETTLTKFIKSQLLSDLSRPTTNVFNESPSHRRGIYLPFCFHCFQAIVTFAAKLTKYYNISFLRKGELQCITLWAGTQIIDKKRMQHTLGKRIDQEEIYCTFNARHIKEMECSGSGASKQELTNVASSIEDFPDVRFIVLEPLQISDPTNSQYVGGRFLGLVAPDCVQRGFRSDEKLDFPSPNRSVRSPISQSLSSPSVVVTPKRTVSKSLTIRSKVKSPRKSARINERNRSPNSVLPITFQSPPTTRARVKPTLQPKILFSLR